MDPTRKRRTSKRQFQGDLMTRYHGEVEVMRMVTDTLDDITGSGSPWLYMYYTTVGMSHADREMGMTGRHCGTWAQGEGWEFTPSGSETHTSHRA